MAADKKAAAVTNGSRASHDLAAKVLKHKAPLSSELITNLHAAPALTLNPLSLGQNLLARASQGGIAELIQEGMKFVQRMLGQEEEKKPEAKKEKPEAKTSQKQKQTDATAAYEAAHQQAQAEIKASQEALPAKASEAEAPAKTKEQVLAEYAANAPKVPVKFITEVVSENSGILAKMSPALVKELKAEITKLKRAKIKEVNPENALRFVKGYAVELYNEILKEIQAKYLRTVASTNIVGTIENYGKQAIAKAANPEFKDSYILALGETHSTGMAREHFATNWFLKALKELKAKGFKKIALELPAEMTPAIAQKQGSLRMLFSQATAAHPADVTADKTIINVFKANGFSDEEIMGVYRMGHEKSIKDQSGSLRDAIKQGQQQILAAQGVQVKQEAPRKRVDLHDRWQAIADTAQSLGMEVIAVDAPGELHKQFQIVMTYLEGIGMLAQQLNPMDPKAKAQQKKLEAMHEKISKRMNELMIQRDKAIAANLANAAKDGKVAAWLGMIHMVDGIGFSTPSAVKLLKDEHKAPVVNATTEFKDMFELGEAFPYQSAGNDLVEGHSLVKPVILPTKAAFPIKNARWQKGGGKDRSYGSLFDAVIILPDSTKEGKAEVARMKKEAKTGELSQETLAKLMQQQMVRQGA